MSNAAAEPTDIPFKPSAFTRIMARLDALPGGGWWLHAGLFPALIAWGHAVVWASGRVPWGTLDVNSVTPSIYAPYALLMFALGTRVAQEALATFWPATGWPDGARARWAFEFRHMPAAYTVPTAAIGLAISLGALLGLPEAVVGEDPGRLAVYVAQAPSSLLGYGLTVIIGAQVVRWLRLVARIHREATAIDPFDRASVFAFSRLTVTIGLAYVAAAYYSLTVNAVFQGGNVVSLLLIGGITILGAVAFVAPLWGIHGHLVRAKAALTRESEARIETVATELHRRVEAGDYAGAKDVTDALDGESTLRDRVAQLPTWPWPPQLLRGFLSALLLPIVLFVLTRFIGAQLGG